MRKRNNKRYSLVIIIVGLVIVFTSLAICSFSIRNNLEKEMEDTLRDVAAQNVLAINDEIYVQYKLLLGFASEIQEHPEREEEIVQNMTAFVESYGLKRMGYAHGDGTAHTTDGYNADVSDRNFFQQSMEGKVWITAAQEEQFAQTGGAINVFSLPVYGGDGEEPTGVIFATYDNKNFQDMMDIDFFNKQGSSCIIKTDGEIIALSNNSPMQGETNFLTHLMAEQVEDSSKRKSAELVQKVRSAMAAGESGIGRCEGAHEAGHAFIFYYTPINENIMADCGLDSKYIQLEITESAIVDNTDIAGLIERFHKAGFIMLLDDFGSGYSSLASLNTLHFDTLKLDKSLIDFIGDESGEKLLEHITKLGQSLGLHITAEGVETENQLVFLKTLCCDDIQGYYFSKPLSMEEYGKNIINIGSFSDC